jgi:DNA-binding NarL/FixJ family response regulator
MRAVRAQLGEQAFAHALSEGRALRVQEALSAQEYTMPASRQPVEITSSARGTHHPFPSSSAPNDLTARELEVLRLVAQGLSDARVAEI